MKKSSEHAMEDDDLKQERGKAGGDKAREAKEARDSTEAREKELFFLNQQRRLGLLDQCVVVVVF